jgi:ankyrin repeat protein
MREQRSRGPGRSIGREVRFYGGKVQTISSIGFILLALMASPSLLADGELFAAAVAGQVERVDSLLAQGADVHAKNAAGRTPLMGAAAAGNVRIIRKLLAVGADPNTADGRGVTPLMQAAAAGFEAAAKALIAAGADIDAKDSAGATVLDKAKKSGQTRIAAFLEQSAAMAPVKPAVDRAAAKPESEKGEGEDPISEAE